MLIVNYIKVNENLDLLFCHFRFLKLYSIKRQPGFKRLYM